MNTLINDIKRYNTLINKHTNKTGTREENVELLNLSNILAPVDIISVLIKQIDELQNTIEQMNKNCISIGLHESRINELESQFIISDIKPLKEVVQSYLEFAVKKNSGLKDRTAKLLKIDRKTLYKKIK